MAIFTKEFLTGGANGIPVLVIATAADGTVIHEAHASAKDEIWLWASNTSVADVKLTIEYGGNSLDVYEVERTILAEEGPVLMVPGWILSGGLFVKAYAATTNVITLSGYVNRIT